MRWLRRWAQQCTVLQTRNDRNSVNIQQLKQHTHCLTSTEKLLIILIK